MSPAQTIDQQTARLLTATAADILAFNNLVQRAGHFWLSFIRERFGRFRSPHSLDVGGGEMVHEKRENGKKSAVVPLASHVTRVTLENH